jgi:Caspase domain
MSTARSRINIVILDACRNNPFARSFRSGGAGLAQMDAPVGTLIAFATAPGSVASDGEGQNGLYTQHLLQSMQKPGMKIEDVFKNVRASVRKDSAGKQIPWESTSLEGDFIFVPQPPVPAAAGNSKPVPVSGKLDGIPAPQLNVGDSWTYQSIDMLSGSVMEKFTRKLTSATGDELRFGGFITDKSLNLIRRVSDGKVTAQWSPRRPFFEFPLNPGKTWSSVGVLDNDDRTVEITFTFKVVRQEQVIVPAGVFDVLRVEGSTKYKSKKKKDGASGEGVGTYRYWFSPVTSNIVALEFEETNWKGVVYRKERQELLSYNRGDKK